MDLRIRIESRPRDCDRHPFTASYESRDGYHTGGGRTPAEALLSLAEYLVKLERQGGADLMRPDAGRSRRDALYPYFDCISGQDMQDAIKMVVERGMSGRRPDRVIVDELAGANPRKNSQKKEPPKPVAMGGGADRLRAISKNIPTSTSLAKAEEERS